MTPNEDVSNFDPEQFLGSIVVDTELSTQQLNCPEGRYPAQLDDRVEPRRLNTKNGPRTIVRYFWVILDDAVKAALGREKVTVPQDIWLDFDDNGALDTGKGKNVDLGRFRDAIGQNNMAGWTFRSPFGQLATVQVSHRSDDNNPERKYAEVRRVSAAT